ncbi:MAG: argininosuccinate lyase [Armatimonadota bacterium]
MENQAHHQMWGGRFEEGLAPDAFFYSHSLPVDIRLWKQDLETNMVHVRMLAITGILSTQEANTLLDALLAIHKEIDEGEWVPSPEAEDIHTAIEQRLYEKVGALAGKLHTGRSRNDQVATDLRLWLREMALKLANHLYRLCETLIETAESHTATLLPGLTHQQHAQPVSLGHHLMVHCWALLRDMERLYQAAQRMNLCPLGSGALAGTSFPIDRELTANELGFHMPIPNSMDAVSDRDFVAEFLFVSTMIMLHLSRMAQELILWSTPEYGFVELADAYTTGSSMMPQKKNPDIAELIRGRSALAIGNLTGMLALLKALPLTYNRDLQDDKSLVFQTVDFLMPSVRLMRALIETVQWRPDRMRAALTGDFSTATDLADYLVRKGMPFREAHQCVGQIVRACIERNLGLESVDIEFLRQFSPFFEADALAILSPEASVRARTSYGGTAPESVKAQIEMARSALQVLERRLSDLHTPV